METEKQFLGQDGFLWWLGTVEDVEDPEKLGRARVRMFGLHTQNKDDIPTEDLPWALPIMPVNTAFTDGLGSSPTGLVNGSIVFGFWVDGADQQTPAIIGTLGGVSKYAPNGDVGFNDPNECFPFLLDVPTTNVAARGTSGKYSGEHPATKWRKDNVLSGSTCDGSWSEPKTPSDPKYPWNSVREFRFDKPCHSEDYGHVEEFDSSPGKERILAWHHKTKNNFLEIHHTGDEVHKIAGNHYELNLKDQTLLVKGDWKIEVEGNKTEYIHGNYCLLVDGHYKQTIGEYKKVDVGTYFQEIVGSYKMLNIMSFRLENIGANRITNIIGNDILDIAKNRFKNILGNNVDTIKGDRLATITGKESAVVGTDVFISNGGDTTFSTSGTFTVEASDIVENSASVISLIAPSILLDGDVASKVVSVISPDCYDCFSGSITNVMPVTPL
jgi:hypothetical protein